MTDPSHDTGTSWDVIKAAHELDGDVDSIKAFYRRWVDSYEGDIRDQGYVAPAFLVDVLMGLQARGLLSATPDDRMLPILDVGCGTGLVGVALRRQGYSRIDGCDLSEDMAAAARRTGAYGTVLGGIDINHPLDVRIPDTYGAVVSCGVFTLGHVPPTSLRHLVPLTQPGGALIVSTRKSYFDGTPFEAEVKAMITEGLITQLDRVMDGPYIDEEGAHFFAFRRVP